MALYIGREKFAAVINKDKTNFIDPYKITDDGVLVSNIDAEVPLILSKDVRDLGPDVFNNDDPVVHLEKFAFTSVDFSSLLSISGESAMFETFFRSPSLTSVDFSSLLTISGGSALSVTFSECSSLTSVDFSSLTTISGDYAMDYAFDSCSSLTSVDFSSLTTISGDYALANAFHNCSSLTSVDLSKLVTISGEFAMDATFYGCSSLASVDLSNLTTITEYAFIDTFEYCTSLKSLSFPSLNSNSFGSYSNQFSLMLAQVTGCTVHFPSNLQSVIGSWSDVTSGFGGKNTTVLFDLPATT